MKVGFNCRYLERPVWTGTEQYLFNLLRGLDGLDEGPFKYLFGLNKNILEQKLILSSGRSQLETITPVGWPGGEVGRFGWDLRGVGSMANRYETDVFHGTSFTLPFGLKMPSAVTFFDLAFLRHPGFYSLKENIYLRWVTQQAAKTARAVITISEFSKEEIVSLLGIDPQKIFAIPLGVSSCSQVPAAKADDVLARYGLKKPYLITVSTVTARKNLKVLFQAMKIMRQKGRSGLKLCIIGRDGFGAAAIKEQCLKLGLGSSVIFAGPVPQEDLAALMVSALGALVPSRYEGFGLPVLEAMAAGVPVVAANASALPEVVGTAGLLADPEDPSDWVVKITSLLDEPSLAQKLRQRGRERAKDFTWRNTAFKTYQVYEKIIS
ncbi:glycosyltransferase family 4 protein [candidate division TA06 bacterium]|nr:glycosyltransferase family 4 protein [candidate division TA06 bacterium]